jgi:cell wall-associated NlpC family hydrolase
MALGGRLLRRPLSTLAFATVLAASWLPSVEARAVIHGSNPVLWSDVVAPYVWAKTAIDHVGGTNPWMRDFAANPDGTYPFQPSTIETRKYFARAVVMAFAPTQPVDPTIAFPDLNPSDPFYPYVNVAVQRHWMGTTPSGTFFPDKPVTTTTVHRVLALALGLGPAVKALNHLHTVDGTTFQLPQNFGSLMLGMLLGLRYNNPHASMDVGPTTPLSRAQVAYSLYRATTEPPWQVPNLLSEYQTIELPVLTPIEQQIVQWGVRYVGYPYVYAGEWGLSTPEPSALGGQPVPGFDCSGLTWWLLRANDGGAWNVAPPRPYAGWNIAQRSATDMAKTATLSYDQLQPGDMMFYDGSGNGVIDHVDTYIGDGWALDSSSYVAGVTIMWVADGWYRDHFVDGRRVLPN